MRATRGRALAVVALLGITAWLVWRAGRPLGMPAVGSWADAEQWYERVGPAVATIAVVRLAALVVVLWLLAAAVLELLAAILPRPSIRCAADMVAPRSLQRLVHGLAGLSLTAGLAVPAPSAGILGGPEDGVAVLRFLEELPPGAGTATLHLVPDGSLPAAPQAVPVLPPAAPDASPAAPEVVVVEAGDSLWSIAVEALADAGDPRPADAAVASYWRRLIEHNRGALVDPANPDLIYPGQRITLLAP